MSKNTPIPSWMTEVKSSHITLKLSTPSELNGVTVDSVTLRTPRVSDMRAANTLFKGDPVQQDFYMYATVLECGMDDLEKLTVSDFNRIQEAYFRLASADGIETGTTAPTGAAAG